MKILWEGILGENKFRLVMLPHQGKDLIYIYKERKDPFNNIHWVQLESIGSGYRLEKVSYEIIYKILSNALIIGGTSSPVRQTSEGQTGRITKDTKILRG